MKKVVILGCENSHANSFLNFIRDNPKYSDVEVLGVYSDDAPAAQKLADEYGVKIMNAYDEAVGQVDGVVVTARHGDNHYKYAKPYIASGVPMFIDKPVTIKESESIEFMRELKSHGIRVCGGSSLKHDFGVQTLKKEREESVDGETLGGFVRAPIDMESVYGGFYFYSQHLVEMVCEIFGRFPKSLEAKQNGKAINVLFHYDNYDCVGLFCDGSYLYYAARMAEKASKSFEIPTTSDWYYREFKEFTEILNGADQTCTHEEFISPVFIMNAIMRSLESGKEEALPEIKV